MRSPRLSPAVTLVAVTLLACGPASPPRAATPRARRGVGTGAASGEASAGGTGAGGASAPPTDRGAATDLAPPDRCGEDVDAPPLTTSGAVAAFGRCLYWVAGSDGQPTSVARRFDVRRLRWQTIPAPGTSATNPVLVATRDALVLAGGDRGVLQGSAAISRFDPGSCRWRAAGQLPWAPTEAAGTSTARGVVIAGGTVAAMGPAGQLEVWSADDAALVADDGDVRPLPPLSTPRTGAAAVTVADTVWVLGGESHRRGSDGASTTSDVERLAPGATAWTREASMPEAGRVFAVALADGTIVVLKRDLVQYSRPVVLAPGASRWQRAAGRFPSHIEFVDGAGVIDDVIYVLGHELDGRGGARTFHVATYDPRRDAWASVASTAGTSEQ